MEVVSCGGQDRVDGIAVLVGEVVFGHSVFVFDMANDRLDGGAPFHLSFDGWRYPPLLASGKDLELVLKAGIVASVSGICQNPLENPAG